MTIRHTIELETISTITLAAFMGILLALYSSSHQPKSNFFSNIQINQKTPAFTASPLPTAPAMPKSQTVSQISSDGTKEVIMKKTYNKDNTQTYTFSTADGLGNNQVVIFTRILDSSKIMSIPFNTWSPDNKYFFVQEQTKDGNVTDTMAFQGSGEAFASGEKYFDLTELFKERNTGNNFSEATGWASETLIIVNTTMPDNTKGPSYWFEVPSKAILQLSTDF